MISKYPLQLLAALALSQFNACGDENSQETVCTELYAYGATVVVTDSVSQEKLSGVTLTATSSAGVAADPFIESDLPDTGTYLGLGEAPGEWTIRITKSGYISQELTVTLESDGCHVEGQTLHVDLVAI